MGSNEAGKSVENIEIDTQGKDRPKERHQENDVARNAAFQMRRRRVGQPQQS
jgi:hypothetical protein